MYPATPAATVNLAAGATTTTAVRALFSLFVSNPSNNYQLVIAGLFASSHLLDLSKSFDPNVAMDLQKTVLQEQNYQVQVIQKIQIELTTESMRLQDKYPELTAKYAEVLEISN